jgi:hypothetical protein
MVPFRRVYSPSLQKGSLVNFQYLFHKHDPNPLVLVTGIYSDGRVAGINLHYLTFVYVRNLLKNFCGDTGFSYYKIKGDKFLYNSFRTYKKTGIRNLHMMDCDVLNQTLSVLRSFRFNPNEIMAIQNQIREQMKNIQNPNAQDMASQLQTMITPHQHSMFKMDKRFGPQIPPMPPGPPGFPR